MAKVYFCSECIKAWSDFISIAMDRRFFVTIFRHFSRFSLLFRYFRDFSCFRVFVFS